MNSENIQKIKVEDTEVEVLNTSENPDNVTKIRADDHSHQDIPFGDALKDTPLGKMIENMDEMKKIRGFFLASLLLGFTGLFVFRVWLGPLAIVFGLLDIFLGSRLTRKAAYVGIAFGLFALVLHFS